MVVSQVSRLGRDEGKGILLIPTTIRLGHWKRALGLGARQHTIYTQPPYMEQDHDIAAHIRTTGSSEYYNKKRRHHQCALAQPKSGISAEGSSNPSSELAETGTLSKSLIIIPGAYCIVHGFSLS